KVLPKLVDSLSEFQVNKKMKNKGGSEAEWRILNDFAFLEVTNVAEFNQEPLIPTKQTSEDCFVIGYPGYIEMEKFQGDYTSQLNYEEQAIKDLYDRVV